MSVVGAPMGAGHIIAHKTASRICHAHSAMHEGLDFQIARNGIAHAGDIGKAHFASDDHAANTQLVARLGSFSIHAGSLRGKMQIELRGHAPAYRQRPHIAHNGGIDTRILQHGEIIGQTRHVLIFHEGIGRNVHLHAVPVRQSGRSRNAFIVEIRCAATHAVALAGQIHGIGAKMYGAFQLLHAASRRQQLHRLRHAGAFVLRKSIHAEQHSKAGVRITGRHAKNAPLEPSIGLRMPVSMPKNAPNATLRAHWSHKTRRASEKTAPMRDFSTRGCTN